MTHPTTYGGRPLTPPPGVPAPELLVAKVRGHARRLFWSALVLVAVAGAAAYFYDNLPEQLDIIPPVARNPVLLGVAALVVLLLVVIPFARWHSRVYTITTRRVMARTGAFRRVRRELSHARGYQISLRRGPIQRLWRCGTLTLDNGVDEPLRLVDVPDALLLQEVLVDQVEVSQILAHRDAQGVPPMPPLPVPPA